MLDILKIESTMTKKLLSMILERMIKKKLGDDVYIDVNDLIIKIENENVVKFRLNVSGSLSAKKMISILNENKII